MDQFTNNPTMVIILGALFAVSEALSFIPALKANGVFQLVYGVLAFLLGKKK